MKGATEEIFVKVTYYKKREGLGNPQWHFTMHIPQCFSQNSILEKGLLKMSSQFFKTLRKPLKTDLCLQNVKKTHYPRAILLKKSSQPPKQLEISQKCQHGENQVQICNYYIDIQRLLFFHDFLTSFARIMKLHITLNRLLSIQKTTENFLLLRF